MKKNSILIALVLVIISLGACNNFKPKDVALKEFKDSINYSFGQWQGNEIKAYYFSDDSTGVNTQAFLKALDEAYSSKKGGDEMYSLGTHVGKYIQDQMNYGHFGDSTLTGDIKLIMAGLINAINNYGDVLTEEQADSIYQAFQEEAFANQ